MINWLKSLFQPNYPYYYERVDFINNTPPLYTVYGIDGVYKTRDLSKFKNLVPML